VTATARTEHTSTAPTATSATTTPDSAAASGSATAQYRRRQRFGHHVAGRVEALQRDVRNRSSSAIAIMARLRASVGRAPGYDYAVLDVTSVPENLLGYRPGDGPTDTEWAKHTALTLYALHQQSIHDTPMHRDGPGLGTAISQLARVAASPDAVRRRFIALGTATSYDATVCHIRGLVAQLRDHKIGLDYGLLADDLVALLRPGGRDRIRAVWGRDFYRNATDEEDAQAEHNTDDTSNDNKE